MRFKKTVILGAGLILAVIALAVSQPIMIKAILAKFKSTDHFLTLENDSRIHYETLAKGNAVMVEALLPGLTRGVEGILGARFAQPANVYICASQESFNSYVFLSKNVRGAVYWGKLFLSPGAFNRGSLSDLISHELTHYLFYTHLGEKGSIRNIPLWFREGLAVFVANGGAQYTHERDVVHMISDEERTAVLAGKTDFWFVSDNPLDAVTKNGVANWLLYRASGLFVHYMHDENPEKFQSLINRLLGGEIFGEALQASFGKNTGTFLDEFFVYLELRSGIT